MKRKSILFILSICLCALLSSCGNTEKNYQTIAGITFEDSLQTAEQKLKDGSIEYTEKNIYDYDNQQEYMFFIKDGICNELKIKILDIQYKNEKMSMLIETYEEKIPEDARQSIIKKYGLKNRTQINNGDKSENSYFTLMFVDMPATQYEKDELHQIMVGIK